MQTGEDTHVGHGFVDYHENEEYSLVGGPADGQFDLFHALAEYATAVGNDDQQLRDLPLPPPSCHHRRTNLQHLADQCLVLAECEFLQQS